MAKVPKEVYILSKWWKLIDKTELMNETELAGETKPDLCEIHYSTKQDLQQLRDTIWHEIKHAVFNETGLALILKDTKEEASEEDIIRRTTPVELAIMRENPDLMKWLLGDYS